MTMVRDMKMGSPWEKCTALDCTGDVCRGDMILFEEPVWGGSIKKPVMLGRRRVVAEVEVDSYGAAKQQRTFTLRVLWSDGHDPLPVKTKTRRKGRNIYRNGTMRLMWEDEGAREEVLAEKHERGGEARAARTRRKCGY